MSDGYRNGERKRDGRSVQRDDGCLSVPCGHNGLNLSPRCHVSVDDCDLARIAVADQRNGPMSGPFRRKGDGPSWNQNGLTVGFVTAVYSFQTIMSDGTFCDNRGGGGGGSRVTFPRSGAFLPCPCSFFHLSFGGKFGFLVLHITFQHNEVGFPRRF